MQSIARAAQSSPLAWLGLALGLGLGSGLGLGLGLGSSPLAMLLGSPDIQLVKASVDPSAQAQLPSAARSL